MKLNLILVSSVLIIALSSNAEDGLTKVYGPEAQSDGKAKSIYVSIRVLEFEGNPFAADSATIALPGVPEFNPKLLFDPLTYFEINTQGYLPPPLNKGADEFFSQTETIPNQDAHRSNVRRGVSGILTDPQFQVLMRFAAQQDGVKTQQLPSFMLSEDQFFTAALDDGICLAGVASPKSDDVIALSLFSPTRIGNPLDTQPNTGLVVTDASTVAYTVEASDGAKNRVYFVTLRMMDSSS